MRDKNHNIKRSKSYIGIVTFYDKYKEFGFILTNSFGMQELLDSPINPSKIFFSKKSLKGIDMSNLVFANVVFNLQINKGKVRATNICKYDESKHKQIAISYCINMNFFYKFSKVKELKRHYCITKYEWVTKKEVFSVFGSFNLQGIDILNRLLKIECDIELKKRFIYILSNVWNKTNFFSLVNRESDNEIKLATKQIIDRLNPNLAAELISSFPLLKAAASPYVINIYNNLVSLDAQKQIEDIIENESAFNVYYDVEDKRNIRKHRIVIPYLIRVISLCPSEKQQAYICAIIKIMKTSVENYVDKKLSECNSTEIKNFISYYSDFADEECRNKMKRIYDISVAEEFCCKFLGERDFQFNLQYKVFAEYQKLTLEQQNKVIENYKKYYLNCANIVNLSKKNVDDFIQKIPLPIDEWKTEAYNLIINRAEDSIKTYLEENSRVSSIGKIGDDNSVWGVLPNDRITYYISYANDLLSQDTPLRLIDNCINAGLLDCNVIDQSAILSVRSLMSIIDKGTFFIKRSEELDNIIIDKIKDYISIKISLFSVRNTDTDVIIDFLVKRRFDENSLAKLSFISCADKLKMIPFNIKIPATTDEIKLEFQKIGPYNYNEILLFHEKSAEAICQIIYSYVDSGLRCPMDELHQWVRLFLMTNQQNMLDSDILRDKFFAGLSKLSDSYYSFCQGVSIRSTKCIPTISDLNKCNGLIWKLCSVISVQTYIETTDNEHQRKDMDCPIIRIFSSQISEEELKLVGNILGITEEINFNSKDCIIKISSFTSSEKNLVLPFIITRLLFGEIKKSFPLEEISFEHFFPKESERVRSYFQRVADVLSMYVWSGTSLIHYRVGDRDSDYIYGDTFKIEFSNSLEESIFLLLKRINSNIRLSEDGKEISYDNTFKYGSWALEKEYDNSENYKSKILPSIINTIFYAYMIGCM